jgi:hypothetical protein
VCQLPPPKKGTTMAVAAKKPYQALVNISLGHVTRGPNGREEFAERVEKFSKVDLTEQEASNLGRYVRPWEDAEKDKPNFTAKSVAGKQSGGPEISLEGTAALDLTNKSSIVQSEDAAASEDAAIKPE